MKIYAVKGRMSAAYRRVVVCFPLLDLDYNVYDDEIGLSASQIARAGAPTLHYTTLHYTTLHYTTLHYTTTRVRNNCKAGSCVVELQKPIVFAFSNKE